MIFKRFFKYTPTPHEQQFIDIVNKLLQHPKTSLRMTPLTDKYFLINEQKHYYVCRRFSYRKYYIQNIMPFNYYYFDKMREPQYYDSFLKEKMVEELYEQCEM